MVSFKTAMKSRTRSVAEAMTLLKQSRFSLVTQAPALEAHRMQRFSDAQTRQRAQRQELLQQRSEEHTSELQSLMRISYAVFCLKKKKKKNHTNKINTKITYQ